MSDPPAVYVPPVMPVPVLPLPRSCTPWYCVVPTIDVISEFSCLKLGVEVAAGGSDRCRCALLGQLLHTIDDRGDRLRAAVGDLQHRGTLLRVLLRLAERGTRCGKVVDDGESGRVIRSGIDAEARGQLLGGLCHFVARPLQVGQDVEGRDVCCDDHWGVPPLTVRGASVLRSDG